MASASSPPPSSSPPSSLSSPSQGDGETELSQPVSRGVLKRKRKPVSLPAPPSRSSGGTLGRRIYRVVDRVARRAEQPDPSRYWLGVYALRVAIQVVRRWVDDRCPQMAASLAFQTVLSAVPLLAVALAALRLSGNLDAESSLVNFLSRELVPVSREVIAAKLTEWSSNISMQTLGLAGLVSTVLLAFVTINNLEGGINAIWRAESKRSLTQKFVVFYAAITIGPFLIGTSLYQVAQAGLTEGLAGIGTGLFTTFGALFLANWALPALPVRLVPAATGALISTLLFETAKYAFREYITHFAFASYTGIYGTLAVVPIWLIWIYYCWLTFLLGIEVAQAVQNLHLLKRADRRQFRSIESELVERVNGVVAARVMAAIAAAYMNGEKVISRRALVDLFDLPNEVLSRITARLEERDLIIAVEGARSGFLPARPPSEITLAEVLAAFRSEDLRRLASDATPGSRLDQVLRELDENTRRRTAELTFADLLDEQ